MSSFANTSSRASPNTNVPQAVPLQHTPTPRTLRVGTVLRDSAQAIAARWPTLLALTVLLALPIAALQWGLLELAMPSLIQGEKYPLTWLRVPANVVELLLGILLQATLAHVVIQRGAGQSVSVGAALGHVSRRFGRIIAAGLLWVIVLMIGAIAFLIPGIVLWCVLALVIPVAVTESGGALACLKRSADLTVGHRWTIFGVYLALLALVLVPILVLVGALSAIVVAWAGGHDPTVIGRLGLTINLAVGVPAVIIGSTVPATLYLQLRDTGPDEDSAKVAEVFA
ncbi:MAG: hypothetical protein ACPGUV_12355 [Polyangiales bacterium]